MQDATCCSLRRHSRTLRSIQRGIRDSCSLFYVRGLWHHCHSERALKRSWDEESASHQKTPPPRYRITDFAIDHSYSFYQFVLSQVCVQSCSPSVPHTWIPSTISSYVSNRCGDRIQSSIPIGDKRLLPERWPAAFETFTRTARTWISYEYEQ